jgi:hypothetical protein
MRRFRFASLLAFTCCLLLSGCGVRTITVKGNLVLPPEVKLEKDETVTITFVPEVKAPQGVAVFNVSDNTFVAQKVPSGKTKVCVQISPYQGAPGSERRMEFLKSAVNDLFDVQRTPLSFDSSQAADKTVTIDLAAKTVTIK